MSVTSWSLQTDYVQRWAFANNVFSPEECNKIIEFGKSQTLNPARIGNQDGIKQDYSIRKSDIAFLGATEEMRWVYQRLTSVVLDINKQYFDFDLWGFAEGLQFTQYEAPTGHYDYHIDKIVGGVIRKLSIVVQLTDENVYEGGNFELHDGMIESLPRTRGTVLFFPSYTLHRVTPVTSGTRYSLVGWISGKSFK